MSTYTDVQNQFNQAWGQAQLASEGAAVYINEAVNAVRNLNASWNVPDIPEVDKPEILNIVPIDMASAFDTNWDAAMASMKADLENRLSDFLDTYFPDYTTKLQTISDWIDDSIANGGTGLSAAVEQAIYDRARQREDVQAVRAEAEVLDAWSARGFPLPTGAAVAAVTEIQQDIQNKTASISRDIMVKQAELEQQNIQFAVQQGVALHVGIINAANQYMNAVLGLFGNATQRTSALIDAIKALYDVIAKYNVAKIQAEDLELRQGIAQSNLDLEHLKVLSAEEQAEAKYKVEAAAAAARALGEYAAAAVGSQNTMALVASEEETSTSSS